MPDILHRFPIQASIGDTFNAITEPAGLDAWWTVTSEGQPEQGATYRFFFEEEYDWYGRVDAVEKDRLIRWVFTDAEPDWTGTRLEFRLAEREGSTWVEFAHTGWPDASEHYRISSYCWAQYLRLLRLYLENGTTIPYADRLNV